MTPQKPVLTPTISFGNIIQTVVIIAGLYGGYVLLEERGKQNTEQIEAIRVELGRAQDNYTRSLDQVIVRVSRLELTSARDDERFSNILQFMSRIDTRLERIEQRP